MRSTGEEAPRLDLLFSSARDVSQDLIDADGRQVLEAVDTDFNKLLELGFKRLGDRARDGLSDHLNVG